MSLGIFPYAVIASAVLDRLVPHAHLVPIVGGSYRMKDLKAMQAKPRNRLSDPRTALHDLTKCLLRIAEAGLREQDRPIRGVSRGASPAARQKGDL